MDMGRTDIRALLDCLGAADQIMHFLNIATGYDADGILERLRGLAPILAGIIQGSEDTVDDSISEEDDSFPRYLAWVLNVGRALNSPVLARYVEQATEFLRVDYHHRSHVVELAQAMGIDHFVRRESTETFSRRASEEFILDIDAEAEAGNWAGAYDALSNLDRLPNGAMAYSPSDQLLRCALAELRDLATEDEFGVYQAEAADELLEFLESHGASYEHPDEFERVAQMTAAVAESRVEARSNLPLGQLVNTSAWVPHDELDTGSAEVWRRIKLVMESLLEIPESN
jgi:hypothetical protein